MKKLVLLSLIVLSCGPNNSETDPMIGTWEGTVELQGVTFQTRSTVIESGTMEWDIYLQNEEGKYIQRYYWPSLRYEYVGPENWLYGKLKSSETRLLVFTPAAVKTGTYSSEIDSIEMPISWNNHYSVADFNLEKTEYKLRNVCVPQEGKLASDELCVGWEEWESSLPFIGKKRAASK